MSESEITWDPPAGGSWLLESAHVQGGQPRIFQERAPRAFRTGFARSAARYGLPIDYLDTRFVNDHCYVRMRPLGAPEPKRGKPGSPPPTLVLWVVCRLHPQLRRRARARSEPSNNTRGATTANNGSLKGEPR